MYISLTDEPEAISIGNREIVLTNSTITLVAFITITGNPQPNVSWTGPDGLSRATTERFNAFIDGQITVQNIISSDEGNYTCTVSNGVGQDSVQDVELVIASE